MEVLFHHDFKKQIARQSAKTQAKFRKRLELFIQNPKDRQLRLHRLKGRWLDYWSFDVTGDIRVVFSYRTPSCIVLVAIGTHAQLYG